MKHVIVLYYDEKETHIFRYQFIDVKQTAGGILSSEVKCPKKSCFLFYEDVIYIVKSKVLYFAQFFAELDEIRYKLRATQGALAHQISS